MALTKAQTAKFKQTQDPELAFFNERFAQLKRARTNVNGVNMEKVYRDADKDYELNRLGDFRREGNPYKGLNLREQLPRFDLNKTDWQSENTDAATFAKIQTALSLMFDRNPVPVLKAGSKKFVATTEIAKSIIEDSQLKEDFKEKLKIYVFNGSKYGTGFARTYIKETRCEYEDLVAVNPITGDKKWEKRKKVKRKIYFEPLNNFNVWTDDGALPNQYDTLNDWAWRKLYDDDSLIEEFGTKEMLAKVKEAIGKKSSGGAVTANEDEDRLPEPKNEVLFYENIKRDMVLVIANGVKVFSGKLPAHKRLSLVYAIWNLRSDLTIHGIGIPEIMRQDKNLLDKMRNMSIDQLVLSIYKMFFYDGTLDAEDTDLTIRPGAGQKVIDPSKLKWLEVPGPGQESINREEMLRRDMDVSTGINKELAGAVQSGGDIRALALLQAKEAGLSKIKVALDNILWAISKEAELRWDLIQEMNMTPMEVNKLLDPGDVRAYLDEIEGNKQLYFHDQEEGAVYALKFPEIRAKVKLGEDGVYSKSNEEQFFTITPELIRWRGDITFTAESILVSNKELDKQMKLDMSNMLIPMLAQDPAVMLKPARMILEIYNEDPENWLPDQWLRPNPEAVPQPMDGEAPAPTAEMPTMPEAETMIAPTDTVPGEGTTNAVDKLMKQMRA